jgi:uridine kinase
VGLAGPSGSGKTVFSEKVRAFMPGALPRRPAAAAALSREPAARRLTERRAGCAILSMDNYNDASRVIDGNFDGARPHALLRVPPAPHRG